MKTITIAWQRLLSEGQTCPRCGTTETEVEKAFSVLKESLSPQGFNVVLEKGELTAEQFAQNTLQSNSILINGKLLEEWIGGQTGQSQCCDVCGPNDCRTMAVDGDVHEVIPSALIIKAGLLAATQLRGHDVCDCYPPAIWPGGGCCPT